MQRPDLEAIKAREQAATAGPWVQGSIPWKVWAGGGRISVCDITHSHTDRHFIAHARADVPDLAAYAEHLEKLLHAVLLMPLDDTLTPEETALNKAAWAIVDAARPA